ncbi:MAG: zinc-dependent metalloprotease [Candidatus Marinimicrobia bacterium]|nr:zinc-dependent metalloprotease [Candidatus Neomarinimicrobiota bacterium]
MSDTLLIPVVFHNIFKVVDGLPIGSYCNFGYDSAEFDEVNSQGICNQRITKTLDVLNAQFAPIAIKFFLHPDFPEMLAANDSGYDGFYSDATGGSSSYPSPNAIKGHYNIPNVLNIYTHKCLPSSNSYCQPTKAGFATYPWSLDDNNLPGVFIRHKSLPGSADTYSPAENSGVGILAHEIGHFFSLLHINGIWFTQEGNTPRELTNGEDCNIHGDLICDTPGSPGYVPIGSDPDTLHAWYFSEERECIYHGYGGTYNPETNKLKIGGNKYSFYLPDYPGYNYCDFWNINDPYDLNNCDSFTNYDNEGMFYGTRNLPIDCLNENKSEYSSDCDYSEYKYLPIGKNFMQSGITTLNYCSPRPIGHEDYDESNHGFTAEQFANIRYSLEHDYTGCNDVDACNIDMTSTHLLRMGDSSCRYPCSLPGGCLKEDAQYLSDYSLYSCQGEKLNLENTTLLENFRLTGIYPNPFNPEVKIEFETMISSQIKVAIYNVKGQEISLLKNHFLPSGRHAASWNANGHSSGIYFLRITSGNHTISAKLIFLQ